MNVQDKLSTLIKFIKINYLVKNYLFKSLNISSNIEIFYLKIR